ncbi:MAG: radical SAM protein [Bacilli bacterium]|nr:radical SAM protein [Bacilli bacterium]
MRIINYVEEETKFLKCNNSFVEPSKVKYKINSDWVTFNCWNASECEREMMVSFFPMIPLLEQNVTFNEADYIIYAHPYARVEDMSPCVIKDLEHIAKMRKPDAEIIVVGKAANAEKLLNNSIPNITFYESHYTEALGKRFGFDIKDEHFVFDSDTGNLNIWPVNGCLKQCSFCRRCYMNIPFESISLEEIKRELDYIKKTNPEMMRCVNLRAENLTEYGIDIYGEPRLHELIDLIDSYDEVEEIASNIGLAIGEINDDVLNSLCKTKKVKFLPLNLEVGSNRLLSLINKGHTREQAIQIYKRLREAHPDIHLTTTVMIGFPMETLIDIYELAELIGETEPNFVLCNFVGIQPKSPLASLPPLTRSLKEYHQKFLLQLLKSQERSIPLEISYEKVLKTNKRSDLREAQDRREFYEEYSLYTIPTKRLVLTKK